MASLFSNERAGDSVAALHSGSRPCSYSVIEVTATRNTTMPSTAAEQITNDHLITPVQLHSALTVGQPPVIIDVRSRSAFAAGHVPTSVSMPAEEDGRTQGKATSSQRLANRGVVLVSLDGTRARQEIGRFERLGYTQVYVLDGGLGEWEALGLPQHQSRRLLSLQNQVQLAVGVALIGLLAKALLLHPVFYLLSAAIASLLVFDGLTRRLALDQLAARLPWNRRGTSAASGA